MSTTTPMINGYMTQPKNRRMAALLVTNLASSTIPRSTAMPLVLRLPRRLQGPQKGAVTMPSAKSTKAWITMIAYSYHVASQSAFQPPVVPKKPHSLTWSGSPASQNGRGMRVYTKPQGSTTKTR